MKSMVLRRIAQIFALLSAILIVFAISACAVFREIPPQSSVAPSEAPSEPPAPAPSEEFTPSETPSTSAERKFLINVYDAAGKSSVVLAENSPFDRTPAERNGYVFDGWFFDEAHTRPIPANYAVTGRFSAYARYKKEILLSFRTNNGETLPVLRVEEGVPPVLPEPTKENCVFLGWYRDEALTRPFAADEPITESCTLHAKWAADEITLTYFSFGEETLLTLSYGAVWSETPTHSDHLFVGWYYDGAYTHLYAGEPLEKDTRLFAKWNPKTLSVRLVYDLLPEETLDLPYGEPLTVADPEYDLYRFDGWFFDAKKTQPYRGEGVTSALTLYAAWTEPYDFTYNGWNGKPVKQRIKPGTKADISAAVEDPLFKLDGWFVDPGLKTPYEGDFLLTEDLTLHVRWIAPCTVTFYSHEGESVTVQVKYGERVAPVDPSPRELYDFLHWCNGPSLTQAYDFSLPVTANITLRAKWLAYYQLSFDPDNGEEPTVYTVKEGTVFTPPEDPEREYCNFLGWLTSGGKEYDFSRPIGTHIAFTARWHDRRSDAYPDQYMCLVGEVPVVSIQTDDGAPITSKFDYIGAEISVQSELYPEWNASCRTEIRGRGNSSWWNMAKKSYRLKLEDKNFNFTGLSGSKHYALIANMADKTNLRNYIAYCLGRSSGSIDWSMDTRFVEVYLNGEYLGLYLLVEVVRAEADRVNLAGVPECVEDTGFLVEQMAEGRLDPLEHYVFDDTYYWEIKYPEREDFTAEEWGSVTSYITRKMKEAKSAINNCDYALFTQLCDENSYIDFWMIQDLFKNFDCFQLSIYLYKPQGGKLTYGPVWDFDIGAANVEHKNVWDTEGSYIKTTVGGQCMFMKEYAAHYAERVALHLSTDWKFLMDNLPLVLEEIRPAVDRNFEKWDIAEKLPPNQLDCGTYDSQVAFLVNWLEGRMEWFRKTYVT